MSTNVEFEDLDDFTKAMAECRSDNIDTNWLVFSFLIMKQLFWS